MIDSVDRRHEEEMDDTSGRSVQAPVVDRRSHGVRLLYQEHPQGQDTLINRCLPQVCILRSHHD